jgi:alpha-beta hydrolase superfamily lysophospholipase
MKREATYLGEGASSFFGWYHADACARPAGRVAVLCGPGSHEYTRAHRTLRHLADRLARAGVPAMRFDYHGIGDSAGSDLDPGRVEAWTANIRLAIDAARARSGLQSVCLIGVRLGASLAALVARETEVDQLMLWNPCVQGRSYLRELQAIAMSAERTAAESDGALESAGSVMTAQTREALRAINLLDAPVRARRVLVASRDDMTPDTSLVAHLEKCGVATDSVRLSGWSGMMAEHQFTVVPQEALETIVDWVRADALAEDAAAGNAQAAVPQPAPVTSVRIPFDTGEGVATIEERACRFGADEHLFGILSRASPATDRPAVVIFNAGAVHRVGPNRVNVTLARNLSAAGFPCFRFDLEGLGDSVLRGAGRENHPYPETAIADARAALDFLRTKFGYERFVAVGLCSGAHTTFHAGLQLAEDSICELVLINPLTFYWAEGMSLETTRHFEDAVKYKQSMRDPRRWLKLLRGDVDMARLTEVVIAQVKAKVKAQHDALRETLLPHTAPRLSRDLRKLLAMKRPVTFFIAEGDPGRDIVMAGAKRTATRALKSGEMRLEMIPGADHTFSQLKPRNDLVKRLQAHLCATFDRGPTPKEVVPDTTFALQR